MGKQSQKPNPRSIDESIENMLKDLHKNKLAAINLVSYLEGDAFDAENHDLEFCQSYVIRLIQRYCKDASIDHLKDHRGKAKGTAEDRAELMLAACGFLRGFEFDSATIGPRMDKYCKDAINYNSSIKGDLGDGSLGTIYRAQLHFVEMELDADLEKLKDKNGGKLGFLSQVTEKVELPYPRGGNKAGQQPKDEASGFWRQITEMLVGIKEKVDLSKCLVICCWLLIAVSSVKQAFFPTAPSSEPKITVQPSIDSNIPVEGIRCTQPLITVYPGVTTPLPIEVWPENAVGAFLLCDSSDRDVLRGIAGSVVQVRASEQSDPGVTSAKVVVTVEPLNPASSDVSIEVPVEVDYKAIIPEPFT